jgi:uncharacterized protein (TIGR02145 family)
MQKDIDLSDITTFANYLCTTTYPYYEELREAFVVLFLTGCRPAELFEIERWNFVSDYNVTLVPQKGNTTRDCVLDSRCDNFIAAIQSQYRPFLGRTYWQFQNLYQKIRNFGILQSGDKIITMYLYRYRFIWQLSDDGYSVSAIASKMGYVETGTPQSYLSAVVKENILIPPIEELTIGGQVWSSRNISLDDEEGGIFYPNDNFLNVADYGLLYTSSAAARIVAYYPGWHIPSKAEFAILSSYLGGNNVAGGKLKEKGVSHWLSPNSGADNSSLFTAVAAGSSRTNEEFYFFKEQSVFLSSTIYASIYNVVYLLYYNYSKLFNATVVSSYSACSLRLIKD